MLTGPSPPWEKTGQWTENFFNTTPPDYTATTEYRLAAGMIQTKIEF